MDTLPTILDGPATTSTLVIICFCSLATDFGIFATFSSFLGEEAITEIALDVAIGAAALLVLALSVVLLGLIASGFTLLIGGGFVSIIFSCTGFSVDGGSIQKKNYIRF